MTIADASQRQTAIDPLRSFCVSAPAGSGKTELLIQRYLALLSRVQRPEQVLAITFTRKAAAEMRERVVEALQDARRGTPCDSPHQQVTRELAEQALRADERGDWQLVRDINRINIKTIDSFCGGLTRQMPILSQFGGQARVLDDATQLYAEAVNALFAQLDTEQPVAADLSALMLHFDNNWDKLQALLVAMLARRDQWREYVGVRHEPQESESYLLHSVQALVEEELAALGIALAPYAAQLLDLQCFAAANLGRPQPQNFPGGSAQELAAWRGVRDLLLTKDGGWRKSLNKTMGFPTGKGEPQQRKEQLQEILGELQQVEGLQERLQSVAFLPAIEPGTDSWQLVLHLSHVLPMLAAQLLLVFQRHGAVDHSQVALSALQALGEDEAPTELALRLDYQLEHILVDEFQDTAINQYQLLHRLTRGWGTHNATNPDNPRTVMIVGDGMQSIYGFRDANVGLFLKAREEGFNGVRLAHLDLQCNFRSDEGVVDWVNETFRWAFPPRDDIRRGQVSYTPASAVRPPQVTPAVSSHGFSGDSALQLEIAFICEQIAQSCADERCASVAVLGRNRSHLQAIIAALRARGIPYAAQDMDSLASSPVAADLLTLCRALANRADRLAWVALLRAPWCGLQLSDLLLLANWGDFPRDTPVFSLLCQEPLQAQLSDQGRRSVEVFIAAMAQALRSRDRLALRVWIEQAWLALGGPATATERSQLEDAESFFQLLEQADREGLGLDCAWLELQMRKRYISAGDGDSKVQLMTLHKAKGLEFDHVIIPQLARPPRSDSRQVLLWDEYSNAAGDRGFLLAADDHSDANSPTLYNYLHRQRQQKSLLEGTRLLYVGATRAVRRLQLTATLNWDEKKEDFKPPSSRSLLGPIWSTFEQQMSVSSDQEPKAAAANPPAGAKLYRLNRALPGADIALPPVPPATEDPNIPVRAVNDLERAVGTVVHLAMEELAQYSELPAACSGQELARWQVALSSQGLWGERLDKAIAAVESSVNQTLADREGRWILSSAHRQARCEWPLSCDLGEGKSQNLVIDRSFLDVDTGVRWIIDYKNSQPERGEVMQGFLDKETTTYMPQLLRYRDVVARLHPGPLRCALYFNALAQLHELEALCIDGGE